MVEHPLRPAILGPRRRRPRFVAAIALSVPLHAVLVAAWLVQPRPPSIELPAPPHPEAVAPRAAHVVPFASPIVSIVPAVAPATTADDRPSCPPPRTDAPRLRPPELDEPITHLEPSLTNAGWIAAWNEEHVFASVDAGATFRRVLDGPGAVRDVSFDCYGRVIVARANAIGVRDEAGESWRPMTAIQLADWAIPQNDGTTYHTPPEVDVLGGGPDLVLVGNVPDEINGAVRLARSRDLGATWSYHDLDSYFEGGSSGRQHADGSIDVGLTIVDCRSEDLVWARISSHGVVDRQMGWIDGFGHVLVGDVALNGRHWQRRGAEDWTEIQGLEDADDAQPIPGPTPIVVAAGRAYRVSRGRARALPWAIEGTELHSDPAGRIWSVVCGQPWITTRSLSGRACDEDHDL